MYVRNVLSGGEFLTVVPIGLPVTLQYNELGILEKVFYEFDTRKQGQLEDVRTVLASSKNSLVPTSISVKGGTTWVWGVLYTSHRFTEGAGVLPQCIQQDLITFFVQSPDSFHFFAGHVTSLATQFSGAAPIRQWLQMSGFALLPGKLVPASMTREVFEQMFNTDTFPFKYPLITHYIIHSVSSTRSICTNISQHIVNRVSKFIDSSGFINAEISHKSRLVLHKKYADVVEYNLHPNTQVVLDQYLNIIYSTPGDDKKRDVRPSTIACKFCGRKIKVVPGTLTTCPDEHCVSRMYPQIQHLLCSFNLPVLLLEAFKAYVDSRQITCLTDVLLLAEYKDQTIETSISQVLRALVPTDVVRSSEIFSVFANRCNNSRETVIYYANHPDHIVSDLDVMHTDLHSLIGWFQDPANVSALQTLLDSPQVVLTCTCKKFDGPPIFRGKRILITGKFLHGDLSEVTSILQSYSAEIVTELRTDAVDCVVVGDTKEMINGSIIRRAKNLRIPIYSETEFFKRYEIDSDLAENL